MAHGRPLVYLDNGATTQKPAEVIERISRYYEAENANIHRGVYQLSQTATHEYEAARAKVAAFIHAADPAECLFTRGTTEGINLVAACWGRAKLGAGDEVIVSTMEHHSNIVPWQMICQATGAVLRVIPMNEEGELSMEAYERLLGGRTKVVAVTHLSNSLGTINDVKRIIALAHGVGAVALVDGAQWVAHHPVDVRDLDADFYAFSGHKLFGPTGIGVLYGKRALLEAMPPYMGGGDMIESVTFEKTTYAGLPNKFEAGTPNIAGAVGLGAAIDFVRSVGFEHFVPYERELFDYATDQVADVPGLRIIGTARQRGSVISFVLENPAISSLDIGSRLDREGVAVRTGHHCCQPVMDRMGIASTARASLALYNTKEDVDALVAGLKKIVAEAPRHQRATPVPASVTAPAESGDGGEAEAVYPEAAAESPAAAADELAEAFEFLGDWQARYEYILDLGAKLLPMPEAMKVEENRVHGCQSVVFLFARARPEARDRIEFLADSDAEIVRGLIGVLVRLYSGQRARDVLKFDIDGFVKRVGLDEHLAMTRRNGLAGMIQRIRQTAAHEQRELSVASLAGGSRQ
jgi:cysteine desulfurase/selenocysteine lyase